MAVLNPPRALPGLGRAIVNFLIESRATWTESELIKAFKPTGLNDAKTAFEGVTNTVSAFRAIGIIETDSRGAISVSSGVLSAGTQFGRNDFRRLTLKHVLDLSRDGDPWTIGDEDAQTRGARDLTRALSWFLAQNALGAPLSWTNNVQRLQHDQFGTSNNSEWPFQNSARWGPFERWAIALGFATPSVIRGNSALIPLPTLPIADAIGEMSPGSIPVQDFLNDLGQRLPVLSGGVIRKGLLRQLNIDPDPGIQGNAVDTSVAQVLRLLETRGDLSFENMADADGIFLSRTSQNRTTHITLKGGNKR